MFSSKSVRKLILFILFVITPFAVYAGLSGSLTKKAIQERLAPSGRINLMEDQAAKDQTKVASTQALHAKGKSPDSVYEENCKMCHGTGLAGAPKFRNKKDWETRMAQGIETMTQKAVQGFKAMPPKGNCLDCSKDDIKATIEYMIQTIK